MKSSNKDKYTLDKKGVVIKYASMMASSFMAGGSVFLVSSCSQRDEQWAETVGKAGYINLEAVEEAMQKSKDVSEFERRVNEIYQGEELILIEVKNVGDGEQIVSGYADLNDNKKIDYDEDEKLFSFRRWYEDGQPRGEMRGYGVNSYYYHPYPPGFDFLTTWLLFSALTRPTFLTLPIYHTTISEADAIRRYRDSYRQTPSYREQINANKSFFSRMSATYGTTYRKASPSSSRIRWATRKGINLQRATQISSLKGFSKTRSWGTSSWGSRGFFRGFSGGAKGCGLQTYSYRMFKRLYAKI